MRRTLLVALLLTFVALSSCGMVSRETAKLTGVSKECVDGVQYLQFTSGATVAVDLNGMPRPCN